MFKRQDSFRGVLGSRHVSESEMSKKDPVLSRKISDAALYGFNRPRELEEMKAEKEPLNIMDDTIPPEMMSAMSPLLDMSRKILWHWKTFPIILPHPITLQADQNTGMGRSQSENWYQINFFYRLHINDKKEDHQHSGLVH